MRSGVSDLVDSEFLFLLLWAVVLGGWAVFAGGCWIKGWLEADAWKRRWMVREAMAKTLHELRYGIFGLGVLFVVVVTTGIAFVAFQEVFPHQTRANLTTHTIFWSVLVFLAARSAHKFSNLWLLAGMFVYFTWLVWFQIAMPGRIKGGLLGIVASVTMMYCFLRSSEARD